MKKKGRKQMSAYSSPDKIMAHMAHLDLHFERIMQLRGAMKKPGHSMAERTLAFVELYRLHHGDQHAQRRLVVELEYAANRELHS